MTCHSKVAQQRDSRLYTHKYLAAICALLFLLRLAEYMHLITLYLYTRKV